MHRLKNAFVISCGLLVAILVWMLAPGMLAAQASPAASVLAAEPLHFSQISNGWQHTCGLTTDGKVKCWGTWGSQGGYQSVPVDMQSLPDKVTALSTSEWHTCALLVDGTVKCWGGNQAGQLGNGNLTAQNNPVSVADLGAPAIAIAAGGQHTCAVLSGGGVKCWGSNLFGELGDGTTTQRLAPTAVSGLNSGVKMVVAGEKHTCALLETGEVKCWGDNTYNQLGDGSAAQRLTPTPVSGLDTVSQVRAGRAHTCALRAGGLWCWGHNFYGQLGDSTTTNRAAPTAVTGLVSSVSDFAAGGFQTCAISQGKLTCWGDNSMGQVGDGSLVNRSTPTVVKELDASVTAASAGPWNTCAILSNGTAYCWGNNWAGQLGDASLNLRTTPTDLNGYGPQASHLSAGAVTTCLAGEDGAAKCWGDNREGQLGTGDLVPSGKPVGVWGLNSGVTSIAVGGMHVCAVFNGGGRCWGNNSSGQLGDFTQTSRLKPITPFGLSSNVSAVDAGVTRSVAVSAAGGILRWGDSYTFPMAHTGFGSNVVMASSGDGYTCVLRQTSALLCEGNNTYGQLGVGTTDNHTVPITVTGMSSNVTFISAGLNHACATLDTGDVACWGKNDYGQLGDGSKEQRLLPVLVSGLADDAIAVSAGANHTCALLYTGAVQCWGDNQYGQLGDGTQQQHSNPVSVLGLASGVTSLDLGDNHSCALAGPGRVKCWGDNREGQLGDSRTWRHTLPVRVTDQAQIRINYPDGAAGSQFTITGWGLPPNTQASVTVNGQVLTTTLAVQSDGGFIFFLDTSAAGAGKYVVSVTSSQQVSAGFSLGAALPQRPPEGGGNILVVPAGLADTHNYIYIALVQSTK